MNIIKMLFLIGLFLSIILSAQSFANEKPYAIESSPFISSYFPNLLDEVSLSSYEKIKAVFSANEKSGAISLTTLNMGSFSSKLGLKQKDDISTLGFSLNINPQSTNSSKADRIWRNLVSSLPVFPRNIQDEYEDKIKTASKDSNVVDSIKFSNELENLKKYWEKKYKKGLFKELYDSLYSSNLPKLSIKYQLSFFNLISAPKIDADSNDFDDNTIKSHKTSTVIDWWVSEGVKLAGSIGYGWDRENSDGASEFIESFQGGVTLGFRVHEFNKNYKNSKEYLESGFIPALIFGLSWENKTCTSPKNMCIDGITSHNIFTPFLDFHISKKAQFRFGLPVKQTRMINDDSKTELKVISSFAISVG
jgi:hypothetical protein